MTQIETIEFILKECSLLRNPIPGIRESSIQIIEMMCDAAIAAAPRAMAINTLTPEQRAEIVKRWRAGEAASDYCHEYGLPHRYDALAVVEAEQEAGRCPRFDPKASAVPYDSPNEFVLPRFRHQYKTVPR